MIRRMVLAQEAFRVRYRMLCPISIDIHSSHTVIKTYHDMLWMSMRCFGSAKSLQCCFWFSLSSNITPGSTPSRHASTFPFATIGICCSFDEIAVVAVDQNINRLVCMGFGVREALACDLEDATGTLGKSSWGPANRAPNNVDWMLKS